MRTVLVRLNNGDGSHTEFDYYPAEKRAKVSLATVLWKFAQRYPQVWKAKGRHPPARPSGNLLRTFDPRTEGARYRQANRSTRIQLAGRESVEGKECRVYVLSYNALRSPATRETDPKTRYTRRYFVWTKLPVILREETFSETTHPRTSQPLVSRKVIVVKSLKLNPPIPKSTFELPAGTVCTVFSDYPTRLPKGVTRKTIAGSGLESEEGGGTRVVK